MAPPADGDRFAVEVRSEGDILVLALTGELDHDTAEPLRAALTAGVEGGARRLLVDFSELRFCDSTGLNVLLHSRLAAREAGGTIELAGLRPPVARMFRITGADGIFAVHPDLAHALAEPRHA
ncbi:STAS domain-containing protein [Streptomyces sp. NRRL F-2664]|uniref:STAS domain-containing protein n=1 Tax=Streptomyces sp. NRRL F-2664 TaxID=1463842 RepID=UPI0004CB2AC4|nr:STAS domain-containing protein [Streptomyces sp. NRRL F-2664]